MPVDQSVHWKPVRDPHYVIASLQPRDGGRDQIFIRQGSLARVERLARTSQGRRAFGLLLGRRHDCSISGQSYLVIDSLREQPIAVRDDEGLEAAVRRLMSAAADPHSLVLGWYCSVALVEAQPELGTARLHASYFPEPWQTMLVVADESSAPDGAFFLRDRTVSRWFHAPFFELLGYKRKPPEAKRSFITWPHYLTMDTVVTASPDQTTLEGANNTSPLRALHSARRRLHFGRKRTDVTNTSVHVPADVTPARETPPAADHVVSPRPPGPAVEKRAHGPGERMLGRLRNRMASRPRGNADQPTAELTDPAARIDDGFGIMAPRTDDDVRRVSDTDDSRTGDDPSRFLELARAEGFFVLARFDHEDAEEGPESLWLLNEPYSGMLLTVVTAGNEVMDASLHYNLRADDAALERAFPEHRDLASGVVYMRESCVDFLRARCRRARATEALQRAWTVSPAIYLLTPSEWHSRVDHYIDASGEARAIEALNDARIAALPLPVRHQFRLATRSDQTRPPYDARTDPEQLA